MACEVVRGVDIDVALDTKDQTRAKIMEVVDAILRQNNAIECGIMARFSMMLGKGAPTPEIPPGAELKKLGVVSIKSTAA